MSYKLQANFAGGELDPVLQKRVSLNKYGTGLATARNVVIGRTGRIMSRPGRRFVKDAGFWNGSSITIGDNDPIVIHPMPWKARYLEFGTGFVQVYEADGTVVGGDVHGYSANQIPRLQFVNVKIKNSFNQAHASGGLQASYEDGYVTMIFDPVIGASSVVYDDGKFETNEAYFFHPHVIDSVTSVTFNGTGYGVEYLFTAVINGEEGNPFVLLGSALLPLVPSATNKLIGIKLLETNTPESTAIIDASPEIRVYRRPQLGGEYGFIGSTSTFTAVGGPVTHLLFDFEDVGQEADYTNRIPAFSSGIKEDGLSELATLVTGSTRTGSMYQGRLVIGLNDKLLVSRPGFPGNFFRDFPLSSDSAITTRIEGTGSSEILHLIENDGLIAFTNDGVYVHRGVMGATNLVFNKKGNHIIDYRVAPLNVPGGTLFVDVRTNTVRQLRYSEELQAYIADEMSIFSDHLFRENRITSWAFDGGSLPLLWVTFADGTYASFTYEESQQMRAWTRHDSGTGVERVMHLPTAFNSSGVNVPARMVFVTKATGGTQRWIEHGIERFINVEEFETNPEVDKGEKIAAMDGIVSYITLVNDAIVDDTITVTPISAGVWDGPLTIACVDDAIFPDPGAGAVGTILNHFDLNDRTQVRLTVTARASDNSITVQPSATYPSAQNIDPRLYVDQSTTLTGLAHLNGVSVGVIVDGYLISSPNNDYQDYPISTPSGGSLTLPTGVKGAIIHVGRVYPMDVQTLDVNSIEQKPTHNEVMTVNKVKVETYLSRGLYVGGRFPDTDIVKGTSRDIAAGKTMEPLDNFVVDYEDENPIIGNRYDQPVSLEVNLTLPGSWKSNGRVCLRQVDPLHFEILALTPDADVQRR